MNAAQKFKETLTSVLPIMAIVLLLGLTVAPLGKTTIVRFIAGGVLLIFGLTVFLMGVDLGILPTGQRCGAALTSRRSLPILLSAAFIIGFMVTIAEPDVQVLANQIRNVSQSVNKWALILMIAVGVGLFVMLGLLRTIVGFSLRWVLIFSYLILFALAFICPPAFQGVAFDAGGATTGPMTVPFILALGVGVSSVRTSGKSAQNESFGLTGISSVGPIMAVCVYGIILRALNSGTASSATAALIDVDEILRDASGTVPLSEKFFGLGIFADGLPEVLREVFLALLPLVIMFAVFQITLLKMPRAQIKRMIVGIIYSFIGLTFFLNGVNGGFMPAGEKLGEILGMRAEMGGGIWIFILIFVGLIFGAIVVSAEPAVWVLTEQVEEASGGNIKRKIMLVALSFGVALSVGLSMLRVFYGFSLWYILVPGYALALILTFFCPPLFTGIAFDSGGVASGPMTSTFILSFTLGAAGATGGGGNTVTDAFGVIALVAMTPLIAIQILGIIYSRKKSGKSVPKGEVKK
ncbi:MAG: DUF1538 domain-containing protein [Treponema sp.]|nr:DUF1538 domain-containing protein [Treponema sp.]